MTLLIVLTYVLFGLITAARTTSLLAWSWKEKSSNRYLRNDYCYSCRQNQQSKLPSPNGDQWFGASCLGLLVGTIWPAAAIAFVAREHLFAPPAHIKQHNQKIDNDRRIAEQKREQEELDRQLEEGRRELETQTKRKR